MSDPQSETPRPAPALFLVRYHLRRLGVHDDATEPRPGVVRLVDAWSGVAAEYDGVRLADALAGIKWPNREPPAGRVRWDAGHEFWEAGGFWEWIAPARLREANP